ncbi:MAG: site-2 protease family protein [Candidatus Moraniibacteriota bacterium]
MDLNSIVLVAFYIIILIYSIVIHEVMHGWVAFWLGDSTAKYAERLNFNPLKHVDPMGSILVPLAMISMGTGFIFGWAKPVPYNPFNLKDQKWGPLLVALGGPLSNLFLALIAAIFAHFISIPSSIKIKILENFKDWASLSALIHGSAGSIIFILLAMVIFWNVLLAVFNLIPIPPLDGSKIFYALYPMKVETMAFFEQYGFILLFGILFIDRQTFHMFGSILSFAWSVFFSLAI